MNNHFFSVSKLSVSPKIQPKTTMKIVRMFALGLAMLAAFLPQAHAQANNKPPGKMTFQGFLTDSSGIPIGLNAPTNITVLFRLYKNSQGSAATDKLWAEQQIVTVDRGHFTVLLGEGTATGVGGDPVNGADLSGFFVGPDASDRFLGIQVAGQSEVAPRMQFFAAPYAHLAQNANNLVSPNGTSILIANPAGNIGIGTTSPERKLTLGDDSINGSEAMLRFESRSPAGGSARTWEIGVPGGTESSLGKFYSFVIDDVAQGTTPEFMIKWGTGFVGIGTTNPASLLDVNGTITAVNYSGGTFTGNGSGLNSLNAANLTGTIDSARLPGTISGDRNFSGNIGFSYGKRIDLGIGATRADSNNGVIGYGTFSPNALDLVGGGTGDGSSRRIVMHAQGYGTYHAGNMGIWRATPRCPLDVAGGTYMDSSNLGNGYAYLSRQYGAGVFPGNASDYYSILAENRVGASEFNAFSDRRIKTVIGPSDNREDLAIIRRLRVTNYRPKDDVAEGIKIRKGFIAQDVEEIIPEAITKMTNWVPNIYEVAKEVKSDARQQQLILTMTNAHGLKEGDLVRLFTDAGRFDAPVARVTETNKFVISGWTNSVTKVFVFGKEVNDFRSLNYDRIFTTGIGAIQELAARFEEKSAQVNALERKISELEKAVEKLAALQDKTRAALERAEKVSVAAK
jgi:hypothetical protein